MRGYQAYDAFLTRPPGVAGQGAVPLAAASFADRDPRVPAYAERCLEAAEEVNQRTAATAGRRSRSGPQEDYPGAVAAYGLYDALVVNPIFDGMNLVAMEGPLVNRRHGALVLSMNAGAYGRLGRHAIGVNPFDVAETADAIALGARDARGRADPPGPRTGARGARRATPRAGSPRSSATSTSRRGSASERARAGRASPSGPSTTRSAPVVQLASGVSTPHDGDADHGARLSRASRSSAANASASATSSPATRTASAPSASRRTTLALPAARAATSSQHALALAARSRPASAATARPGAHGAVPSAAAGDRPPAGHGPRAPPPCPRPRAPGSAAATSRDRGTHVVGPQRRRVLDPVEARRPRAPRPGGAHGRTPPAGP